MRSFMLYLILVCRTNAHNVDGNVEIQKHGDKRTCTCGKNLTITCKLKEHRLAMAWMNGNSIISIAECVESSCNLNPAFNGQYAFSYNIEQGIYNLTVIKVTKKDNGKRLVCSDGSHTDFLVLKVNGHDAQLIEDKQSGSIIAKSGCISDERKVTFKWISVSPDNGLEQEIQREVHYSNDSCVNDSVCGFNQHTTYRAKIFAKHTGNGKYIKFAMEFGSERIESRKSDALYLIEEQDYGSYDKNYPYFDIIAGIVGLVFCLTVAAAAVSVFQKRRTASKYPKKQKKLQNEEEKTKVELLGGDILQSKNTESESFVSTDDFDDLEQGEAILDKPSTVDKIIGAVKSLKRRKSPESETTDNSNQQNKVNISEKQYRSGKNDCSNRLGKEHGEIDKNESSIIIEAPVKDGESPRHNSKETKQCGDEDKIKQSSLQEESSFQVEHYTQCQVASPRADTVRERMKYFASSAFEMLTK